jgi:ankyrin repeat protein
MSQGKLRVTRFLTERMGFQLDAISENPLADLVQSSLDHMKDTTPPNSEKTSLHTASCAGNLAVVLSFLDHEADVNERNGKHATPLDVAARKGSLEVSRLLIKRGPDVNPAKRLAGLLCTKHLPRFGHQDIARLLFDHGADVNTKKLNHISHQAMVTLRRQVASRTACIYPCAE